MQQNRPKVADLQTAWNARLDVRAKMYHAYTKDSRYHEIARLRAEAAALRAESDLLCPPEGNPNFYAACQLGNEPDGSRLANIERKILIANRENAQALFLLAKSRVFEARAARLEEESFMDARLSAVLAAMADVEWLNDIIRLRGNVPVRWEDGKCIVDGIVFE